jgi:hypothetical protein
MPLVGPEGNASQNPFNPRRRKSSQDPAIRGRSAATHRKSAGRHGST